MYQLTSGNTILRLSDNAHIPQAPGNRDYAEYLEWLDEGNEPQPYVPPTPVDGMTDVNEAQSAATTAVNSTAYSLLQPTDWTVVREVETGISKRSAISNYRADVRAAADEKVAAIAALATVEEVQGYLRGDAYATWPSEELLTKD